MAVNTLATNIIAKTAVFESRMRRARGTLRAFDMQAKATKMSFGAMALGITATVTTAVYSLKQAGDAFLYFIGQASNAQEATNAFNIVFGKTSDEAAKFAQEFSDKVGRSVWDVRENLVAFQDTLVPLGATREQASALSQSLVTLAIDVASLRNKMDSDVIENFQSALIGNVRAVRKYGIVLSQERLKQAALEEGFKGGLDSLDGLNKALLRGLLIIKDSRDSMGDAAATAWTWANQVKRLEGNWTDFSTALGHEGLTDATRGIHKANAAMVIMKRNTRKIGDWAYRIVNGFMGIARLLYLPIRIGIAFVSFQLLIISNTLTNIATLFLKIANITTGINIDGLVESLNEANDAVVEFATKRFVGLNIYAKNMVNSFKNAFGDEGLNKRRALQQRAEERAKQAEDARKAKQAAADEKRFAEERNRQAQISGSSTGTPKTQELSGLVSTSGLSIGTEFTIIGKLQTMIDQGEVTNTLIQKTNQLMSAGNIR